LCFGISKKKNDKQFSTPLGKVNKKKEKPEELCNKKKLSVIP